MLLPFFCCMWWRRHHMRVDVGSTVSAAQRRVWAHRTAPRCPLHQDHTAQQHSYNESYANEQIDSNHVRPFMRFSLVSEQDATDASCSETSTHSTSTATNQAAFCTSATTWFLTISTWLAVSVSSSCWLLLILASWSQPTINLQNFRQPCSLSSRMPASTS